MRVKYLVYGIILALAGLLYYLYANTRVFATSNEYYGIYKEVNGLQESDAISVNGVKIGYIDDILIEDGKHVKVVFAIDEDLKIPEGTVASISRGDFTGMKSVHLKIGSGPGTLPPGSRLITNVDSTLVDEYHAKVEPIIRNSMFILRTADSAMSQFNYMVVQGWGVRTQEEIEKFRRVTGNFARVSESADTKLQAVSTTLDRAQKALGNPAERNASINESMAGLENSSSNLASKDLKEDFNQLRTNIQGISRSLAKLKDNKMINDTALYTDLTKVTDSMARSMKAMKENPPAMSVFGKKK